MQFGTILLEMGDQRKAAPAPTEIPRMKKAATSGRLLWPKKEDNGMVHHSHSQLSSLCQLDSGAEKGGRGTVKHSGVG